MAVADGMMLWVRSVIWTHSQGRSGAARGMLETFHYSCNQITTRKKKRKKKGFFGWNILEERKVKGSASAGTMMQYAQQQQPAVAVTTSPAGTAGHDSSSTCTFGVGV